MRGCVRFEAGGSAEEGAAAALECSLLTISLDLEEEVECDEQLCDELGWDLALTRTEAGGTGARSSRTVGGAHTHSSPTHPSSPQLPKPPCFHPLLPHHTALAPLPHRSHTAAAAASHPDSPAPGPSLRR